MEINDAIQLFRERLGREPTADEVSRIQDGLQRGRDPRRVIAGYMAMDYLRSTRGPNAMVEIRRQRRSDLRGSRGTSNLRQKAHEFLDALLDFLEGRAA